MKWKIEKWKMERAAAKLDEKRWKVLENGSRGDSKIKFGGPADWVFGLLRRGLRLLGLAFRGPRPVAMTDGIQPKGNRWSLIKPWMFRLRSKFHLRGHTWGWDSDPRCDGPATRVVRRYFFVPSNERHRPGGCRTCSICRCKFECVLGSDLILNFLEILML